MADIKELAEKISKLHYPKSNNTTYNNQRRTTI